MRAGKSGTKDEIIEPLHLVLVEEPEAHLHVQVQQVFIRKAYNQALNLAKAGTIESITFDAYTGAVNCLSVFVCLLLPLLHRLIG